MNSVNVDFSLKELALILEDEKSDAEAICMGLDFDGAVRPIRTPTFLEFYKIIAEDQQIVCVTSIDWYYEQRSVKVGRKAIETVQFHQPWAVTIVYSNDNDLYNEAINELKADFFFDKGSCSFTQYQRELRKAARLGQDRVIAYLLKALGEDTPSLPRRGEIGLEIERELFRLADKAVQKSQEYTVSTEKLLQWLRQRGWVPSPGTLIAQSEQIEAYHLSDRELNYYFSYPGERRDILCYLVEGHLEKCIQCRRRWVTKARDSKKAQIGDILEEFRGRVDDIREGIAYLNLADKEGRLIEAKYDGFQLQSLGFDAGSPIICRIMRTNSGTSINFQKTEAPIISDEEWERELAEVEAMIGTGKAEEEDTTD